MRRATFLIGPIALVLAVGMLVGFEARVSATSSANPLDYTGKEYVGTYECASCHTDVFDTFKHTSHPGKVGTEATIVPEVIDTWNTGMPGALGNPVVFEADEPTGIAGTRDISLADGTELAGISGVYVVLEGDRQFRADFYDAAEQKVHEMPVNVFHIGAPMYRQAFAVNLQDGFGTRLMKYQYSLDDFGHFYYWRDRNQARIYEVNCIGCHVVGFDLAKWEADKNLEIPFTTVNLGIGCESCHGPGSIHADDPDILGSIVHPTRDLTKDQQVHLCSQCHIRGTSHDGEGNRTGRQDNLPFRPGDNVLAYFTPMPLELGIGTTRVATDGKARASRQQFMDHYIGAHAENTCTDCHGWHANNDQGQLFWDDIPATCGSCHGRAYTDLEEIRGLMNGRVGWEGNDAGWWMNHTFRYDDQGRVVGFPVGEWPESGKWPWDEEGFKFDWEQ